MPGDVKALYTAYLHCGLQKISILSDLKMRTPAFRSAKDTQLASSRARIQPKDFGPQFVMLTTSNEFTYSTDTYWYKTGAS